MDKIENNIVKNNNKKNIYLSIGIMLTILLVIGGTAAALILTLNINVSNGIYNYAMTCFDITYESGGDVTGTLIPSKTYSGGLDGGVSFGIDPDCNVSAKGEIVLNVKTASDNLVKVAKSRCENSTTLETMKDYTTEDTCTSAGGDWVSGGSALKYAVLVGDSTTPLSTGYIIGTGEKIVYRNFWIPTTLTDYHIYIWLDGELIDNTYENLSFESTVDTKIVQVESEYTLQGEAYAVYSEDDNSLRFYRSDTPITVGSTYNDLTVTNVYTGFENTTAWSETTIPWYSIRSSITSVSVEDEIQPKNMAYWFKEFTNCGTYDVTNIDTSNVTDLSSTFYYAGQNSSSLNILGLQNWDTSNVTSMFFMFHYAGRNASESWTIGDIGGWDVSNVTDMNYMFYYAGYSATSWTIGDIGSWDISNVVGMNSMFSNAGYSANYYLDLSVWNVSNVTSYANFNANVSSKVIAPSFGSTS